MSGPVTNGNEGIDTIAIYHSGSVVGSEPAPEQRLQPELSPTKPVDPIVASGMEDRIAHICLYTYGNRGASGEINSVAYVSNSLESIANEVERSGKGGNKIKSRNFEDTNVHELDIRFSLELTQKIVGYDFKGVLREGVYVHEIPNAKPAVINQVKRIIDSL